MGTFSYNPEAKDDTLVIPFLKLRAVNNIDNEDNIFLYINL